ncbi:uncharacterized protein LACBIDRAFT_332574 [Laccaria bicolor S238N-H82]|uniref:Predicted protein n=1 Tax=Laccaria bicolor (strain S238N-H82 / ATCC MYA-4686) TaxID=486041 RepID=B0DT65_LACBS|nr:uncharacterized protein LACBIDRAFT_332574 [Laccaria bicolor S238N-H82]EDR02222.1 predicted protein [Laccaria bicolor S238N-H82]|eukprot:XP_001887167.1 predicted protein [Laccaria bicolor S238N-H82]
MPFGGFHIALFGDFPQLPPIGDTPLYSPPSTATTDNGALSRDGSALYWLFVSSFCLRVIHRQQGASIEQENFRKLLLHASKGGLTQEDWTLLDSRAERRLDPATQALFRNAVCLYTTRNDVLDLNMHELQALNQPWSAFDHLVRMWVNAQLAVGQKDGKRGTFYVVVIVMVVPVAFIGLVLCGVVSHCGGPSCHGHHCPSCVVIGGALSSMAVALASSWYIVVCGRPVALASSWYIVVCGRLFALCSSVVVAWSLIPCEQGVRRRGLYTHLKISYCNATLASINPLAAMCFHLALDAVKSDGPRSGDDEQRIGRCSSFDCHVAVGNMAAVVWVGGGDGCSSPVVVRVVMMAGAHRHPWVVGTHGRCGRSGGRSPVV